MTTADAHPKAGMVGSRVVSFFDPDVIDSVGIRICKDGMSRGANRNGQFSRLNLHGTLDILFPSACSALYKRAMLDEIGFFDSDFFAYCEDTDLGLRGRLAGWQAVLNTDAVTYHKYSKTGGELSAFKIYHVERNHYWAAIKSFPPLDLFLLPLNTALRYFEQFKALKSQKGDAVTFAQSGDKSELIFALLRGIASALMHTPEHLLKRRATQQKRKIPHREMRVLLKKYNLPYRELFDIK